VPDQPVFIDADDPVVVEELASLAADSVERRVELEAA
jgi:hypothetical protein